MVGMLRVSAKFSIIPGSNSIDYFNKREKSRVQMNRKEMDLVKHKRKQMRAIRKRLTTW